MSAGHKRDSIGLNSGALDFLLTKHKEVKAALLQIGQRIDCQHDLPYLAGYSESGDTIYIDRHLPSTLNLQLDGQIKEIDPVVFLLSHERLEKALIDTLDYGYDPAHKAATAYERRHVLMVVGPGWWPPYQKVMDRYIKADEHEKLQCVPADLDMTPYFADPINRKLIARMEEAMGKAKSKRAKTDVDYGPGRPGSHCGRVAEWPKGRCKHFETPRSCKLVRGAIDPDAWCKLWEPAYERKET